MMILYLTNEENIGLFDYISEEEPGTLFKKYCGEFELKKFIIHDSRNLNPFDYFIVDLEALNDSEDELISAIIAFASLFDSRLIVYAEKASRGLLERIIDETNIYNIITGTTIEIIKEQMKTCMSNQGMTRERVVSNLNKDLDSDYLIINPYSFVGESIRIMVFGSMNRVGTTTTALNLASFLASLGAKVSYTEANNSSHLKAIYDQFFFNNPIEIDSFSSEHVEYFFRGNIPSEGYNFNIIDLGTINESNIGALRVSDINLLCGSSMPYEKPFLKVAIDLIKENKFFLSLPLGSEIDYQDMKINKECTVYQKHTQNLFDGTTNQNIFKKVMGQFVFQNKSL